MVTKRTFLDFALGESETPLGRVVFELWVDLVPKTCEKCVYSHCPDVDLIPHEVSERYAQANWGYPRSLVYLYLIKAQLYIDPLLISWFKEEVRLDFQASGNIVTERCRFYQA